MTTSYDPIKMLLASGCKNLTITNMRFSSTCCFSLPPNITYSNITLHADITDSNDSSQYNHNTVLIDGSDTSGTTYSGFCQLPNAKYTKNLGFTDPNLHTLYNSTYRFANWNILLYSYIPSTGSVVMYTYYATLGVD